MDYLATLSPLLFFFYLKANEILFSSSSSSSCSVEDVRQVLEVRELPQGAGLPEEVPAAVAGRLPGVRGGHAVAPLQDGRSSVAIQRRVLRPAPPGTDALPLGCAGLHRPLQVGGAACPLDAAMIGQISLWFLTLVFLFRMRFLVRRWHKATGLSTTTSCIIGKNGTGLSLGNWSTLCFCL